MDDPTDVNKMARRPQVPVFGNVGNGNSNGTWLGWSKSPQKFKELGLSISKGVLVFVLQIYSPPQKHDPKHADCFALRIV